MTLVFVVVGLAVVFVIAAAVVGREAGRLDAEPPRPVFDIDEATEWVADHVPFEVSAQLSHEDVQQILRWHLEYFRSRGVSSNGQSVEDHSGPIVVGGGETVDFVLGRATALGLEYTAEQIHAVLDAQMAYLQAIGAIGPAAGPDEVPPDA